MSDDRGSRVPPGTGEVRVRRRAAHAALEEAARWSGRGAGRRAAVSREHELAARRASATHEAAHVVGYWVHGIELDMVAVESFDGEIADGWARPAHAVPTDSEAYLVASLMSDVVDRRTGSLVRDESVVGGWRAPWDDGAEYTPHYQLDVVPAVGADRATRLLDLAAALVDEHSDAIETVASAMENAGWRLGRIELSALRTAVGLTDDAQVE